MKIRVRLILRALTFMHESCRYRIMHESTQLYSYILHKSALSDKKAKIPPTVEFSIAGGILYIRFFKSR